MPRSLPSEIEILHLSEWRTLIVSSWMVASVAGDSVCFSWSNSWSQSPFIPIKIKSPEPPQVHSPHPPQSCQLSLSLAIVDTAASLFISWSVASICLAWFAWSTTVCCWSPSSTIVNHRHVQSHFIVFLHQLRERFLHYLHITFTSMTTCNNGINKLWERHRKTRKTWNKEYTTGTGSSTIAVLWNRSVMVRLSLALEPLQPSHRHFQSSLYATVWGTDVQPGTWEWRLVTLWVLHVKIVLNYCRFKIGSFRWSVWHLVATVLVAQVERASSPAASRGQASSWLSCIGIASFLRQSLRESLVAFHRPCISQFLPDRKYIGNLPRRQCILPQKSKLPYVVTP